MSLAQTIAEKLGNCKPSSAGYFCNCPCCHKEALHIQDDSATFAGISAICGFDCDFIKVRSQLKTLGLIAEGELTNGISDYTPDKTYYEPRAANGTGQAYRATDPDNSPDSNYRPDEQPRTQEPIETFDGPDWFDQSIVESPPIIPGLFDEADKIVLIGQSKTRKSFFAMQLALCLASGRSFLGFPALDPARVLVIQFEIRKNKYHARFKRMINRLQVNRDELGCISFVNARGKKAFQAIIEDRVKAIKPKLVILDPFYKLVNGDESKIEDVKQILQFFDEISEAHNCAVLYVHHDKKGVSGDQQLTDRGSGSGVLARDFDSAIFLTPHRTDEDSLVVEFIARNHAPIKPITATWANDAFMVSDTAPLKQNKRSMDKDPIIAIAALVKQVKEVLLVDYIKGIREYPMNLFNEKLRGLKIDHRRWSAVKESLLDSNIIEITNRTRPKSFPIRYVILLIGLENEDGQTEPVF